MKRMFLKKIIMVLAIFVLLGLICGCVSIPEANTTTSPNVRFSNYTFANITGIENTANMGKYYMDIQNSLSLNGYNVIRDTRIQELNANERARVMIVYVAITTSYHEHVCIINITDYLTGNVLMSTRVRAKQDFWMVNFVLDDVVAKAIEEMENVIKRR